MQDGGFSNQRRGYFGLNTVHFPKKKQTFCAKEVSISGKCLLLSGKMSICFASSHILLCAEPRTGAFFLRLPRRSIRREYSKSIGTETERKQIHRIPPQVRPFAHIYHKSVTQEKSLLANAGVFPANLQDGTKRKHSEAIGLSDCQMVKKELSSR